MYRLSGNDPATDPSVNAAMLDGAGPLAYTTQVDGLACIDAGGCAVGSAGVVTALMDFPVTVPADGILSASYTYSGSATPVGTNAVQTWLTWDDSSCGSWFFFPLDAIPGSYAHVLMDSVLTLVSFSGQSVFEASAGSHTLTLCVMSLSDDLSATDGHITSLWTAMG